MNRDVCGFSLSFFMHATILGAFLYLCPTLDLQPKTLVIDFSLIPESVTRSVTPSPVKQEQRTKPPPLLKVPPKPRQLAVPRPIEKVLLKSSPETVVLKKIPTRPVAKILPQKEEKVVQPETLSELADMADTKEIPAESPVARPQPAAAGPAATPLLARGTEESVSAGPSTRGQQYIKAHFIYIKKLIEKNISYPPMARRMGWQGKVVVSFVVCQNGTVENLEVVESSGHAQLDKNALETVRQVEPFPDPPARVKLVLPITYRIS